MRHVAMDNMVRVNRTLNQYLIYADSQIRKHGEKVMTDDFVIFLEALEEAHQSRGFVTLLWGAHKHMDFFDLARYGEESLCENLYSIQTAMEFLLEMMLFKKIDKNRILPAPPTRFVSTYPDWFYTAVQETARYLPFWTRGTLRVPLPFKSAVNVLTCSVCRQVRDKSLDITKGSALCAL